MTREEIAEGFREAAGVALKASLLCKANGNTELSEHYGRVVEAFKTRAAQVEAMRCETCNDTIGMVVDGVIWCRKYGAGRMKDDGCFQHKPKVMG